MPTQTDMRVVWLRADGGITVTSPARAKMEGESEEYYLDNAAMSAMRDPRLQGATRLPNMHVSEFPKKDFRLPGDTSEEVVSLRNCWRWQGGQVRTDLGLARQTYVRILRAERARRLKESDGERARLEEVGTAQQRQALATYRQQLRDLPATVQADLAALTTPDALAAYQPPWPTPPQ